MTTQLGLFGDTKIEEPEPMTEVRLGHRAAQYPLRKKRREAIAKLLEILEQLEGKDIHVGSYEAGGRHFWLDNLKLPRLKVDFHPYPITKPGDFIPGVIVLWGNRNAQVRIFTDYLVAVREQEYQCYWRISSKLGALLQRYRVWLSVVVSQGGQASFRLRLGAWRTAYYPVG